MATKPKIGGGVKLTIQIVNFRSRHYLERCLFSISENLPVGFEVEVLIVNNDEEPLDEPAGDLKKRLSLQVLEVRENIGFGRAHNAGFRHLHGEYVLFLNPDTKIFPGVLQALLDVFEKDPKVGIVGPLLVGAAARVQPDCYGTRRTPLSTIRKKIFERGAQPIGTGEEIFETSWISGGAMLARSSVFEQVGGFDENFFMYFEDVDLCLRAEKAGAHIAVNPKARVFHESGKSFASEREKKRYYYASQDYYTRKHFGRTAAGFVKLLRLPYYVKNVWLK